MTLTASPITTSETQLRLNYSNTILRRQYRIQSQSNSYN